METSVLYYRPVSRAYRADSTRGSRRTGRVSSGWSSRPDDERYLSLPELYRALKGRAERATTRIAPAEMRHVETRKEDGSGHWPVAPRQDSRVTLKPRRQALMRQAAP